MIEPSDGEALFPTGPVPFRCDVYQAEDRAIVAVRGEVDMTTAPELYRDVLATFVLPLWEVRVDLRHCAFLDSSGIRALVDSLRAAKDLGIAYRLTSVPGNVLRVLQVAGVAEMFGLRAHPDGQDPPLAV